MGNKSKHKIKFGEKKKNTNNNNIVHKINDMQLVSDKGRPPLSTLRVPVRVVYYIFSVKDRVIVALDLSTQSATITCESVIELTNQHIFFNLKRNLSKNSYIIPTFVLLTFVYI